ncbi:hypothetical protein LMG18102_04492 [Ralstonia mannitolilytica]|nr:hypothetical protein LMG18102_04492 [Ralstonia mannitolilytica]
MKFNQRSIHQQPRGAIHILLLLVANLCNNFINRDGVCQEFHTDDYCRAENGLPFIAAFNMHSTQTLCGKSGSG